MGILMGIALNPYITLGNIDNFFWRFKKIFYCSYCYFIFIFLPCHEASGILIPRPGIEPVPPALEVQSLNHGPPGKSWHFNNIKSSNPWTQDPFSFIYVNFHFFKQCFSVFSVQVTSLLKLVPKVLWVFFFDIDWLCLQERYTVLGMCMFPLEMMRVRKELRRK